MNIKKAVKFSFAFTLTECTVCDDTVWLEPTYRLPDGRHVCKNCCGSREEVYDCFYPETPTARTVTERVWKKRLEKEKEKLSIATEGIKKVIAKTVHSNKEWNPVTDMHITQTVIDAENILRDVEKHTPS
jgi:hypothetical protein